jgi:hypothetical protein
MRVLVGALAFALGTLGGVAPVARAALEIEHFDAQVVKEEPDEQGVLVFEQAGGHPFEGYTEFAFATDASGQPTGVTEDIRVDIPVGLIPNPQALPQCTDAQLLARLCPDDSQVGVQEMTASLAGLPVDLKVPLYNMTLGPDQVARIAFNPTDAIPVVPVGPVADALLGVGPVEIVGGVRENGDFGMFFTISDLPEAAPVIASKLTFWGIPAAEEHNAERGRACALVTTLLCFPLTGADTNAAKVPFLTNPTRCDGVKLHTSFQAKARTGEVVTASASTPTGPDGEEGPQRCEDVPFEPSIAVAPDSSRADSPTGPLVAIDVPQPGLRQDVLATSHVEDVALTLPPGMTINPSAAAGLEACTDEQLGAKTGRALACPEASRIGDVRIDTPLLPVPLTGGAYIGQPLSGDRYRLFLAVTGQGVDVRLKGSIRPDPATGQVTTVFADNPQVPFERLAIDFRDGALAPLATPADCGQKTATASLVPHSGTPAATPSSSFAIGGCDGPAFAPSFGVATATADAGAFSPFSVSFGRDDGQQPLGAVSLELPPGLLGLISRVEQCDDARAAAGACPLESRIGTASVRSGAGPQPFPLSGPVYLTGPYKGAPFGLAVVIRAIAGPFDLGTVVVRQAIHVDPVDAHLRVVSDPLPAILEGVPLRLRSVDVTLDRPGFMVNPTSCGAKEVRGSLGSTLGATAAPVGTFAVAGCERLPLSPRLRVALTGSRQTRDGGHPGVRAVVTQPGGQSNLREVRVRLPISLALDPANARGLCEFEDGLAARCPESSVIGRARAISPVLNRPIEGPVYFVKGVRIDPRTGRRIRTLPTLLAKMRGEVEIHLRARTDVERGRLVSTFESIPDAPISRFDLALRGGRGGVLVVTTNRDLCSGVQRAGLRIDGHSGKRLERTLRFETPCRSPRLRIRSTELAGDRLTVAGTIARAARGRIAVRLVCDGSRATRAARARRGRWKVSLPAADGCRDAARERLVARYGGGPGFHAAKAARTLRLPG